MQRLILMRHGKAERAQAGMEDIDRGLTRRGAEDAAVIGRVLNTQGLVPDRVLVSPARRTQETWKAAARHFPAIEAEVRPGLYMADAAHVLAVVEQDGAAADTVMVVGHNPGLHELALRLLAQGSAPPSAMARFRDGFPTATAAVFHFDASGRAAYDGLFLARDFGGGGGE